MLMIIQPNIKRIKGSAVFQIDDLKFESKFEIEYSSVKAFIKFYSEVHTNQLPSGLQFFGHASDGISIAGEVDSNNFVLKGKSVNAGMNYLHIGNEDVINNILEVKAILLGVYYPFNIAFQYEKYFIELLKAERSIEDAKRTKAATGAILEGNELVIKGDQLSKREIEQLLVDICMLLRPICCGEIYFGCYNCNNELIIFPKNLNLKGTLFGLQNKLLQSNLVWKNFFLIGLSSFRKMQELQKQEYINIGYALSTSSGCGTMETAISTLIQTIEYIGYNTTDEVKIGKKLEIKNILSDIKKYLNTAFDSFVLNNESKLPPIVIDGIKRSINKIQPWDPIVIKKVKSLLSKYNWDIDFDFEEFKKIRDSLAHSGMFPSDFPYQRRYELKKQYETILYITAMDLLGVGGKVEQTGKDGWIVSQDKNEVKNNKLD